MNSVYEQAMECYKNHQWQQAEALFMQAEGEKNVASYLKKCRQFQKFSVGQIVSYGQFEGRDIRWRVMDERGNMRLLLCDGLLTERPYQDLYVDTWWENSALRKWLNGVFVKECFAPEEGRNILNVRVETPASEEYYTNGGNRTMDRVFVLSKAEVLQYLPEVEDRNLGHWWWMRTPGSSLLTTAIVYTDGTFYNGGVNVSSHNGGVRPAMWVLLKG